MNVVLFKLDHWCMKSGCTGGPGDVIEVSKEIAAYLTERKGGMIVSGEGVTEPAENQVIRQQADPDSLVAREVHRSEAPRRL